MDFEIEFSCASVWYHVVKGRKKFFFIKPSKENLAACKDKMKEGKSDVFFPDAIKDKTYEIVLKKGEILLIPTDYIRAIFTLDQSLMFVGNFLHSLRSELQIQLYRMDEELKTKKQWIFPNFKLTHWLTIPKTLNELEQIMPKLTRENCSNDPLYSIDFYNELRALNEKNAQNATLPGSASGSAILTCCTCCKRLRIDWQNDQKVSLEKFELLQSDGRTVQKFF